MREKKDQDSIDCQNGLPLHALTTILCHYIDCYSEDKPVHLFCLLEM
jgi:hypothetical protein